MGKNSLPGSEGWKNDLMAFHSLNSGDFFSSKQTSSIIPFVNRLTRYRCAFLLYDLYKPLLLLLSHRVGNSQLNDEMDRIG